MSEDRDLLERALRRFEPEPGLAERVMRRRDRKRRNQRILAGVVGGAIALAVVLAVTRPVLIGPRPGDGPSPTASPTPVERIGFIGVPPEGAEPSTPVAGDLVLSLDTTVSYGDSFKTTMYVYADGRMIWERHGAPTDVPEGAKKQSTGYLEQVLTAAGVEALRSEVLGTGLFEGDLHLKGEFADSKDFYGVSIQVRGDRGMVSLDWARGYGDERQPTRAERDTIGRLVQRLSDPGAWLPESTWQDRQIRAYVASSYWVTFSLVTKPNGDCCLHPDPSTMPPPADEILGTQLNQCFTTDEARRLAESFDTAGIPSQVGYGVGVGTEYETGTEPDTNGITQQMLLYPNLPHWSCP